MKVTGIITTYNREPEIIERAIISMLNQTHKLVEVLVIDDNENHNLLCENIKDMCDKYNIKYVKQDGNKGACAARNLGIKIANGDYIAFLDDDDEWLDKKIELELLPFKEDPKIGMTFCGGYFKNLETGITTDYYNSTQFQENVTFDDLLKRDCVGSTSHPLLKKDVFYTVGMFLEEQPARQDYEMWIRISQRYKIKGINEKLFIYYYHEGEQISKNRKKSYWGYRNIYKRYFQYYLKNDEAHDRIVTLIYRHIYNISIFNIWIFILRCYYKIREKL